MTPLITGCLLAWYAREKRPLPWRRTRDPYRIWISEVMLQQTQVETVIPFYRRFLKTFPSVDSLARASLDEVLKAWEGMGYYARARNLHTAARQIMDRFGGKFPSAKQDALSLPGIGPYTAGAVLSIAFGKSVAAVDGNIARVLSRIYAVTEPVDRPQIRKRIECLAETLVPDKKAGDFNQALMDLGATVCRPQGPLCRCCPVEELCLARRKGIEHSIPVRAKRNPLPHRDASAAVIRKGKKLLVVQRPGKGLLGGLWKFPGGMREKGEAVESSLVRRVREEVGIEISIGEELITVNHSFTHFRVTIRAFKCRPFNGARPSTDRAGWRWMDAEEINRAAFSNADRKILNVVLPNEGVS